MVPFGEPTNRSRQPKLVWFLHPASLGTLVTPVAAAVAPRTADLEAHLKHDKQLFRNRNRSSRTSHGCAKRCRWSSDQQFKLLQHPHELRGHFRFVSRCRKVLLLLISGTNRLDERIVSIPDPPNARGAADSHD
jgi:hypothetical protein